MNISQFSSTVLFGAKKKPAPKPASQMEQMPKIIPGPKPPEKPLTPEELADIQKIAEEFIRKRRRTGGIAELPKVKPGAKPPKEKPLTAAEKKALQDIASKVIEERQKRDGVKPMPKIKPGDLWPGSPAPMPAEEVSPELRKEIEERLMQIPAYRHFKHPPKGRNRFLQG